VPRNLLGHNPAYLLADRFISQFSVAETRVDHFAANQKTSAGTIARHAALFIVQEWPANFLRSCELGPAFAILALALRASAIR
jgi:hypothetical protein